MSSFPDSKNLDEDTLFRKISALKDTGADLMHVLRHLYTSPRQASTSSFGRNFLSGEWCWQDIELFMRIVPLKSLIVYCHLESFLVFSILSPPTELFFFFFILCLVISFWFLASKRKLLIRSSSHPSVFDNTVEDSTSAFWIPETLSEIQAYGDCNRLMEAVDETVSNVKFPDIELLRVCLTT